MSEQLQPDSIAAALADFDRRLRNLEVTARVGLNRLAWVQTTGTGGSGPSLGTAWHDGVSTGYTWTDHLGNTGSGYGEVTVSTNSRVLLMFGGYLNAVASSTNHKCSDGRIGISEDGGAPPVGSLGNFGEVYFFETNDFSHTAFHWKATTRRALSPGNHTWRLHTKFPISWPAGTITPVIQESILIVIPID